jgi:tetratricopeptide (TPR) repeat protein
LLPIAFTPWRNAVTLALPPVVTKKDKALAAAQRLLERGQYDKALAEFARVVQEDPKDTRTWLKMAEIYARRGAGDQARDIYLRTGELYVEQGFLQKAIAVYKNVLKLSPGLAIGHLRLGDVYRELGLVADALQQLELGATALQKAGRVGDALLALRQIVKLHPENVVSRIKLAESASQGGATEEAVREFAKAAEQLKAQGRSDEYVRVAERLLFHQPDNFDVARELAAVYIGRNNPRLALAKLQGPLKAAPRDPHNIELLARALEPLDGPKATSVWKELADIHHQAGRIARRDAAVRAAMAVGPRDPDVGSMARRWGVGQGTPEGDGPAAPSGDSAATPTPAAVPLMTLPSPSPPRGLSPPRGVGLSPPQGVSGARPPPFRPPVVLAPPSRAAASGAWTPGPTPRPDQDVSRILSEAEVFVKYGLYERAVEHVRRVFEHAPDHPGAREKLAGALVQLGRRAEAASELAKIAVSLQARDPGGAQAMAERALALDPACARAAAVLGRAPASPAVSPAPAEEPSARSGLSALDLEAELEQVDFFLDQELPEEARSLLEDLRRRFPDDSRLAEKERAVARALAAADASPAGALPTSGDTDRVVDHGGVPVAVVSGGGSADLSTHGDLGIAYKEMGLFDAAIAEFRQLTGEPAREVFALTMIGECQESKGTLTDAVIRYKEALNCPDVTPAETLVLYYLLGCVFERLGDRSEALYFFDKVAKRDPRFRDVDVKIATLRGREGPLPRGAAPVVVRGRS